MMLTGGPLLNAIEGKRACVQKCLLEWAANFRRAYPWRESKRSVYEILVAEILLKRTTATAAARAYEGFLWKFPSLQAITHAAEEDLAQALSTTGLQWQRAKAIKALSLYLFETEGGEIPRDLERLRKVPGLGDYGARAILSFGYGIPAAVLDANVGRILHRLLFCDMASKSSQALLQAVADVLLFKEAHREFNFALLDLGNLVCRYSNPRHRECPLKDMCDFYKQESQSGKQRPPASRLRAMRSAMGIGLAQFAKESGISKLTIVNIEAGRTTPQPETIKRLAAVLKVGPEEFIVREKQGK